MYIYIYIHRMYSLLRKEDNALFTTLCLAQRAKPENPQRSAGRILRVLRLQVSRGLQRGAVQAYLGLSGYEESFVGTVDGRNPFAPQVGTVKNHNVCWYIEIIRVS